MLRRSIKVSIVLRAIRCVEVCRSTIFPFVARSCLPPCEFFPGLVLHAFRYK